MKWLLITLLIILYVFQTYESNYLAVPVISTIHRNGRETFAFQNNHYESREELIVGIKNMFQDVPKNYLLLHVSLVHFGNRINNTGPNNRFLRADLNDNFGYFNIHDLSFLIRVVVIRRKLKYICNYSSFSDYQSANNYLDNIKKYDKMKSQYELVGKDVHGWQTWYLIWKKCYYRCFSRYNFRELSSRLENEFNKYKIYFRNGAVTMSFTLHISAKKLAKTLAKCKNKMCEKCANCAGSAVVAKISAPFANIQVNKWYKEYLASKQYPQTYKIKTKNLQSLFSQQTTKVGFGVAMKGKYMIIVYHCYSSRNDLVRAVKKQFQFLPTTFLLIHLLSISHGIMVNSSILENKYYRVKLNDNSGYINIKNTDLIVETSGSGKKLMYSSNDGYYDSYKKACENIDNVRKYDRVRSQFKVIGKDMLGRETWYLTWYGCYYKCFSRNNFFFLGTKFIEELNIYRKEFSLNPVTFNPSLYNYASFAAKSIAEGKNKVVHRVVSTFSNEAATFASAPFANTQMNKWYEQFLSLKVMPKRNLKKTKIVQALFSRYTTKVAFGAAQKGKFVVIVALYK
uniref:SCP domain-containing protein n=1 Tax=Strongyloides stercoralis TaxID=6248 RepID=A0A0K0EM45_STRER